MAFKTTKDVLDHAREFHGHVSEYYRRLSEKNRKARVKMLLDYMIWHEKELEKALARYEEGVSEKVLNTWFQYPPPEGVLQVCMDMNFEEKENLTVDDVVDMALELDKCLIQLYEAMVERSEYEEVREVFKNLLEAEKRRKLNFVRDAMHLKEI
jgi:hypothetical protein